MTNRHRASGQLQTVPNVECEYSEISDTFRVFLRGKLEPRDLADLLEELKGEPRLREHTILVLDMLGVQTFKAADLRESLTAALSYAMTRMAKHVILVSAEDGDVMMQMRATSWSSGMKLHPVAGRLEIASKLNDLRGLTSLSGV